MFKHVIRTVAFFAVLVGVNTATKAQDSQSLPGGATSLSEAYGDWTVSCGLHTNGDETNKICNLVQEQLDSRTRQRVLAVELRPEANGAAKATFLLPFGLDLKAGLTTRVDDRPSSGVHQFRTCLPAGCLVEMEIGADLVAELGKGTQLKLDAVADGGKEARFAISLKGFQAAYKRTTELAK